MIDSFTIKQAISALVDDVAQMGPRVQYLEGEVQRLHNEVLKQSAMFDGLLKAYQQQRDYFNEIVPGFTDAYLAKSKLEEVTNQQP